MPPRFLRSPCRDSAVRLLVQRHWLSLKRFGLRLPRSARTTFLAMWRFFWSKIVGPEQVIAIPSFASLPYAQTIGVCPRPRTYRKACDLGLSEQPGKEHCVRKVVFFRWWRSASALSLGMQRNGPWTGPRELAAAPNNLVNPATSQRFPPTSSF